VKLQDSRTQGPQGRKHCTPATHPRSAGTARGASRNGIRRKRRVNIRTPKADRIITGSRRKRKRNRRRQGIVR